jgi:hypothetical protein
MVESLFLCKIVHIVHIVHIEKNLSKINNFMNRIYRVKDISKIIDRDKTTLFRWEKEGKISPPQRDSRGWRIYTENDIIEMKKLIDYQIFDFTRQ